MPAFTKKVKKLLLNDKQLVDEFLQSLRVLGLLAMLVSLDWANSTEGQAEIEL